MKSKINLRHVFILIVLFCISCEGELEDCYETVCTGPDNTNCQEEPNFNSGCFPMDNGITEETDIRP